MLESPLNIFQSADDSLKSSILIGLVSVSSARLQFSNIDAESKMLVNAAASIGVNTFDLENYPRGSEFTYLKRLSAKQKIWFVTEMHVMATYDGRLIETAITKAKEIAQQIGIGFKLYQEIIDLQFSLIAALESDDPLRGVSEATNQYKQIILRLEVIGRRQKDEEEMIYDEFDGDEWEIPCFLESDPIFHDLVRLFREDKIDISKFSMNFRHLTEKWLREVDSIFGEKPATGSVSGALVVLKKHPKAISRFFCAAYPEIVKWYDGRPEVAYPDFDSHVDFNWHFELRNVYMSQNEFLSFECSK